MMNIFKNFFGQFVAYLPSVRIVDPACVSYEHSKQETYQDCCKDIINGCDIGIKQLQELRERYEKRMVTNAMGVSYDKLEK
jgi:hypothetical protein